MNEQVAEREIVSGTLAFYEGFLVGTSGNDFALWFEFSIFINEIETNKWKMKSPTKKYTGKKEGLGEKWEMIQLLSSWLTSHSCKIHFKNTNMKKNNITLPGF